MVPSNQPAAVVRKRIEQLSRCIYDARLAQESGDRRALRQATEDILGYAAELNSIVHQHYFAGILEFNTPKVAAILNTIDRTAVARQPNTRK